MVVPYYWIYWAFCFEPLFRQQLCTFSPTNSRRTQTAGRLKNVRIDCALRRFMKVISLFSLLCFSSALTTRALRSAFANSITTTITIHNFLCKCLNFFLSTNDVFVNTTTTTTNTQTAAASQRIDWLITFLSAASLCMHTQFTGTTPHEANK